MYVFRAGLLGALMMVALVITSAPLAAQTQASFSAATNFPAGTGTFSVTTADFNGDTFADIATANPNASTVSVLLGEGAGGFSAPTNFPAGSEPTSVTTADFNGDGNPDIATANNGSTNGTTYRCCWATGRAASRPATNFAVGTFPYSVTTADFNGDTFADIATANLASDDVSVLLGNGTGGFSAATNFTMGDFPTSVTTADFNGDTFADIATANYNSNNLTVRLGDGQGGFSASSTFAYTAGSGRISVTTADFNGDTFADIATADNRSTTTGNRVSVLLGDGTGGFSAPVTYAVGNGPYSVTTADFNGDTFVDIAAANNRTTNGNNVSVLRGDGTGGFLAATNFAVGSRPYSVTTADFNGDTLADISTANNGSSNVSVLLNTTNVPPVAVDDTYDANEDATLNVAAPGVLGNDTDANGNNLTASLDTDAQSGSVNLNPNGSFTYTPEEDFFGTDSLPTPQTTAPSTAHRPR
jgi:protein-L-isoaspartate O-methyltransferase